MELAEEVGEVVGACVGCRLVGDASLAEQIGEAARCAGVADALQRVEASAIGRSRLAGDVKLVEEADEAALEAACARVGCGLVGDASLAKKIGEAARWIGVVDALQRVGASAIGRVGLATLVGEEEGSRPEQVSGRRCTWPHGGRQMSGGRCDICQRVAYHCGSQ